MMPAQTILPEIQLSDEFKDLCMRMRALSTYEVVDSLDALALSLMWETLADDFEDMAHHVNAGMCLRRSMHWKNKHAEMKKLEPEKDSRSDSEDPAPAETPESLLGPF